MPPGAQAHRELAPERARSVSRNRISDRKALLEKKAAEAEEAKAKANNQATTKVSSKHLVSKGRASAPPAPSRPGTAITTSVEGSPNSPGLQVGDGIPSPKESLDLASTAPSAAPGASTGSNGGSNGGSPKGKETTNAAKRGGALIGTNLKKGGWGWSSKRKGKAGTSLDDTELKSPTLDTMAAFQVGARMNE